MNIKSFILLVVALLVSTSVFADTEYLYELEIDYDFDEDEEIECRLELGDRKKTETFDENDDRDDMSYEGRFDDDISVECNEKVDIDLRVLDLEDNEVEDIRETNVEDFYYELQLFEGVIDISYDFPSNVEELTCDLEIDETREIITYDKSDDDRINEEIEFEFLNEITFDCSERLDELRLRVEDPVGFDIYDLYLEDENEIDFDESTPRHQYDIAIFFRKDFEEDTSCDVDIDSDSEFTIEFEESSSGSDRQIEYVFGESFSINCDENFEEALVDIQLLEDDDIKVFEGDYFNTDSFSINKGDIESYQKEEEIPEEEPVKEEEKPEKVIIPEVVNPVVEEKEESEDISDSIDNNQNNNIEQEDKENNSTTTTIEEEKDNDSENNQNTSEPVNMVYVFIGLVSIILVIAIVILVIKL